jgi:hypothetical protein
MAGTSIKVRGVSAIGSSPIAGLYIEHGGLGALLAAMQVHEGLYAARRFNIDGTVHHACSIVLFCTLTRVK